RVPRSMIAASTVAWYKLLGRILEYFASPTRHFRWDFLVIRTRRSDGFVRHSRSQANLPILQHLCGCGLGGGSIYWIEKYDCAVTGVSLVPEHLDLVHMLRHTVVWG